MKVRRLLLDEHAERLKRNICPRCKKFSLNEISINEENPAPPAKFKIIGSYFACSGPLGYNCYFISSIKGSTVFESSECVDPIEFNEEPVKAPVSTVVRRRNGVIISKLVY
jgi:hypothetical protein